jgi:uncharacterized protein (UPF0332 family)
MAFDWADYAALANSLREQPDEASQRTAISRLYYSTFHQAPLYLESEGLILSQMGPGTHRQVWEEFTRRGSTHRPIGIQGFRLHANRVSADYDDQLANLDELVEESFQVSSKIRAYLKRIQAAKNPN